MALAGIFPGQGAQSVGMLSQLAESFPTVRQTFEQASDVLGLDLWHMAMEGPEEDLNQTMNTQPAMLAAGVAVWRVWSEQGGEMPVAMAGHSLGEYSALVATHALRFGDAVALVRKRAELMQQAVPAGVGAMAAILGLDDEAVIKACAEAASDNEVVQAVNFNSPGQVVIAGNKDAVLRALEFASEAGAKRAIELPVSVPSHCDLMQPAAEELSVYLADVALQQPVVDVLHNVDAARSESVDETRQALAEQLYRPVKWVDTIENLYSQYAADSMIEFGPGKVLFGLNRRINKKIKTICVHDNASLEKALALS